MTIGTICGEVIIFVVVNTMCAGTRANFANDDDLYVMWGGRDL